MDHVNIQNHPHHPPPLTAIGRFLQGQSCQSKFSRHSFERNKVSFVPSTNRIYGFGSSSNNESKDDSLVPCFPMDKIFASHVVLTKHYHNIEVNSEVTKSCMKMKSKGIRGPKHLIKGQWTNDEDRKLVRLVKQHGVRKWSHIAEQMMGRVGKQCRERWHNHLRPDIKKDTWSEDEERMLVEVHRKVGNKWAQIAQSIPGRTENAIKNHWNATKRRQISRRKSKKNDAKNRKLRPSILEDYIRSNTTTNASDHNFASITTTANSTQDNNSTNMLNNSSITDDIILPNSPSLNINQSYEEELTFMQSFFTSNESVNIQDSKSFLDTKSQGFSGYTQYGITSSSYSSISNDSFNIKDSNSSPYGFPSCLSVPRDNNSNLYSNKEDSSKSLLAPDVYISYLLEGSTPLLNSSDLMFDAEESAAGFASNEMKEMDLVEMMLSSQFSHGSM